ncbi:hypothetical protein [Bradyrhizobium sp.]|uniref:hypothetical protein n=1 Tax=Bradyrhizobium sp. TaxID=376 RepID=UPI002397D1C0|nr:hypothetical protein [Bradyrhizobium sp.]MDE2377231.1 hypothetical protein [Bradyrhizobium sp.]
MSHAEYVSASKQVPVLSRLVTALRQIPAVQSALARLRALLGRGTNPEPTVISAFVADAGDVTKDVVEASDATPAPAATSPHDGPQLEPVIADTFETDAANNAADAIEIADVAPVTVQLEPQLPSEAASPPVIIDAFVAEPAVVASLIPEVEAVASALTRPAEEDREALIRRRWRETGVRMWTTGQSVLRIQGSVALLPPKPGETMPQYDTLEIRLIGGEIVCEGFVLQPPERGPQRA